MQRVKSENYIRHMKILVLTTFGDDEWVFDAIRAGASGYILKDITQE